MVGKIISHHRIMENLGEGEMGVVCKAEDTRLKRTAALRFLPQEAASLTRGLHREAERRYISPYLLAVCCAGLGDDDESFRWPEKGFEERSDSTSRLPNQSGASGHTQAV